MQHLLKKVVLLLQELASYLNFVNLLLRVACKVLLVYNGLVDRRVLALGCYAVGIVAHLAHHVLSELSEILRVESVQLGVLISYLLNLRRLVRTGSTIKELLLVNSHGLGQLLQALRIRTMVKLVLVVERVYLVVFAVLV